MIEGKVDDRGLPIDVKVMQSHQYVAALKRAGLSFSEPQTSQAILDTGAGISAMDHRLIRGLGLQTRGVVSIHTPSTDRGGELRNVYDASIVIGEGSHAPMTWTGAFVSASLAEQGFFILIGRDILRSCALFYNGPHDMFQLAW